MASPGVEGGGLCLPLPVRAPAGGPFVPRAAGSTGTELLPASFVGAMSEPAYRL